MTANRDGRERGHRGNSVKHFRRALGALSSAALLGSFVVLAAGTGAASTAATAAPSISNPPRIPVSWPQPGGPGAQGGVRNTWAASNWSGYAETGTFAGVSSTWTVPTVAASSSATYSSAWIGVDGFNNSNLIQTGTEEDYYSGAAHYNAWWEILPAAETALPSSYAVTGGDRMSAKIYETSATTTVGGGGGRFGRGGGTTEHVWDITISDTTRGWTYSTSQAYAGTGSSAEWIMEAPEVNGRIATLAHYAINAAFGHRRLRQRRRAHEHPERHADLHRCRAQLRQRQRRDDPEQGAGLDARRPGHGPERVQRGIRVRPPGDAGGLSHPESDRRGANRPRQPTAPMRCGRP